MKYKIIADSSANCLKDYIIDENVGFDVAPLTIRLGDREIIDDDKIDVGEMLDAMNNYKGKPASACPSPFDYLSKFEDADNIIVVTITKKLSGSYNSAVVAAEQSGKNVHVIDSKGTAGNLMLIVDKAYELMKDDSLSFEEIVDQLEKYRDNINLLFVLDKFDNLVKNGRMSKVVALIAKTLVIKPLCYAKDGEIEVLEKIRTAKGAFKRLLHHIGEMIGETTGKACIIAHTKAAETAALLCEQIKEKYNFLKIKIIENRGLNSFYALEKGVIVSFG